MFPKMGQMYFCWIYKDSGLFWSKYKRIIRTASTFYVFNLLKSPLERNERLPWNQLILLFYSLFNPKNMKRSCFDFFVFQFVHFFFSFVVVLVPLFWRIEIKSVGLLNCSLIGMTWTCASFLFHVWLKDILTINK